jgi:hypothetical protein
MSCHNEGDSASLNLIRNALIEPIQSGVYACLVPFWAQG